MEQDQIEWLAKGKKPVNPIVYNKAWSFQQYFLFKANIPGTIQQDYNSSYVVQVPILCRIFHG